MSLDPDNKSVEGPEDYGSGPAGKAKRWIAEISMAEKECQSWWEQSRKIERRYRDERNSLSETETRFNVLWSNVQTLAPACYARPPQPVVGRRFRDADPVARAASTVLQRNLLEGIEQTDLHGTVKQCVLDWLLSARGTVWLRYEPHFVTEQRPGMVAPSSDDGAPTPDDDGVQTSDEPDEAEERVAWETVEVDFVNREDFLHSPARTWKEVRWVGRKVRMTRGAGIERFGKKFQNVPLDWKPAHIPEGAELGPEYETFKRAVVIEIWSLEDRKVLWIAPGYGEEPLDERDDPLKLERFFPCPKPMFGTVTNETLVPVPDYKEYQDQAGELDELTGRLDQIAKAIKVAGTYDASVPALARIFTEGIENELIPVDDWRSFAQKGGLEGCLDLLPMQDLIQVLQALAEVRSAVKNDLYEETGIADILRGSTQPEETATAQRIKGRYATMRLSERQTEVARFVRDILRLMAEIMCHHFSPETLALASNFSESELAKDAPAPPMPQQPQGMPGAPMAPQMPAMPPGQMLLMQAIGLLKNDKLRGFRVDVEDQSTIAADDDAEKKQRTEFLTAVGSFLNEAMQVPPQLAGAVAPTLGKMLLFGVRAYKAGSEMESAIEEMVTKLQQVSMQPTPPDPKTQLYVAQAQKAQAEAQQIGQQAKQKAQETQLSFIEQRAQDQQDAQQHGIDMARLQLDGHKQQMAAHEAQQDAVEADRKHALDMMKMTIELEKLKIERERMAHERAMGAAQIGLDADRLDHEKKQPARTPA